ncbi:hypothetical protein QQF64_003338 [Cirrhinus molitorella]|uniref:Uncharacterized protein n=1 Tax=Cirrhinus molitorella TaxID=172907 RepID=A0ABR3ML18_9TELE
MGEDVYSFRSGPQSSACLGEIVWNYIEQDVDTMSRGTLTLDRSSVYHAYFLLRLTRKLRAQISQCKYSLELERKKNIREIFVFSMLKVSLTQNKYCRLDGRIIMDEWMDEQIE